MLQGDFPRGEMQMSAKEEMMFSHKYSSENQPHLNAASGSGGAYFICISLLLLFSLIMCCVISAATAPREHSSSSRVNALKQM